MSDPQILQMFGLIYTALGIGMFINTKFYKPFLKEYKGNPAMTMLTGIITFVLGFAIVSNHNTWSSDIGVVMITILGWLSLIEGFLILAFPNTMIKIVGKIAPFSKHMKIWSLIIFILGLILLYLGCV